MCLRCKMKFELPHVKQPILLTDFYVFTISAKLKGLLLAVFESMFRDRTRVEPNISCNSIPESSKIVLAKSLDFKLP